jgi:hypothetical protein
MENVWFIFTEWVVTIPWVWIVLIFALLGILHPLFENPAGILMITFLATAWQSPWLAALYLWGWNIVGLQLLYDLLHRVQPWGQRWLKKRNSSASRFLTWLHHQPAWKHFLVMALPLVYTYPLRIAWTLWHPTRWRYTIQSACLYALFHLANIALYTGVLEVIDNRLPLWVFALILTGVALFIYAIKPRLISNPSTDE